MVRDYLRRALDEHAGPVRVLSLCAGDGRDVIGVLAERDEADRVSAVLVELDPHIAETGRVAARQAGLDGVEVRTLDAADPTGYADAWPADVVLLVGIFGNISHDDLWRTIDTAPALCRPGATLLWSRGRDRDDLNDAVRARFAAVGFTELGYDAREDGSRPALGLLRYDGPPVGPPAPGPLFTFFR